MSAFSREDDIYKAHFKVYHGGKFVTKNNKTEYIGGKQLMKYDYDEVCYFNLVDIVKSELQYEDGEIWFKRQGLSLFAGRKKINNDKDIESLMASKDDSGVVNLYVVQREDSTNKPASLPTNQHPNQTNDNFRSTNSVTIYEHNLNPITHKSTGVLNTPPIRQSPANNPTKSSKLPIKRSSNGKEKVVKSLNEIVGDEEDSEELDPDYDVLLSDGDYDNETDDDIFAELENLDVSDNVNTKDGFVNVRGFEEEGVVVEVVEDDELGDDIELVSDAELVSDKEELGSEGESDEEATYPGQAYKEYFWKAARAYTKAGYDQSMETIKMMSVEAFGYLSSIPTVHWCRHAFRTNSTSAMLLNNCCESFNNALKKCRDKPILSMMEWIRRYNMKRMLSKRVGVNNMEGNIMPAALKQLLFASKESKQCEVVQSGIWTFEVDHYEDRFVVDLDKRTCGCRKWDMTGIPCAHAYKCIMKKRLAPETYIHQAYTKDFYMKAYVPVINPVPGPKQWEKTIHPQPDPPPYRKMPGRPSSKKRRKEAGENVGKKIVKKRNTVKQCSHCGHMGHNKKGCTNPGVPKPHRGYKKNAKRSTSVQNEVVLSQQHQHSMSIGSFATISTLDATSSIVNVFTHSA